MNTLTPTTDHCTEQAPALVPDHDPTLRHIIPTADIRAARLVGAHVTALCGHALYVAKSDQEYEKTTVTGRGHNCDTCQFFYSALPKRRTT